MRQNGLLLIVLMLWGCADLQAPAPVTLYGGAAGAGSTGAHTVSKNETIYTISKRYDVVMQDIVATNHLTAPFALHTGQRIKLPPPQTYRAKAGDTIYSISRLFGVSSTDVARLNHWQAPYAVSRGQMVKLPSVIQKPPPVQMASLASKPSAFGRDNRPLGHARVGHDENRSHVLRLPPGYKAPSAPKDSPRSVAMMKIKPDKKSREALAVQAAPSPQEPAVFASRDPVPSETPKRGSSRFLRPVSGKILSGYGAKPDGLHNDGINIKAAKGTPVRAAENGVVVYAGNELKGTGNLVLIRHEGRWMTAYAHMDQIKVKRGAVIKRGQNIGTVGSTGSVDSPQLHFEVRRGTEAINPVRYLES